MRQMTLSLVALLLVAGAGHAQDRFGKVVDQVNRKMVKVFGAGGFKGLASYGTGLIVSPNGYVLTADSHILTSQNIRVHLHDGRKFDNVKVVASEPELDVALLKIDGVEKLPHFDIATAAQQPLAQTGDWVLAFSNQFQIATRDEPMTVQRGTISSYSKLHGRRGIHDAPYSGDVYFLDAITNNPGAAGGALTNRKGELLGIIGKELRNTLTDIWMNYAMPIQAKVEVPDKDKPEQKRTVSVVDFVRLGLEGKYKQIVKEKLPPGVGGFHGIVTVPDVLDRTPPYVEEVASGSPAAAAGVKPDDLLVYIDGEQVGSVKNFMDIMSRLRPGSRVQLEVRRGDKLKTIEIVLKEPLKKKPK
jgi:S1-C subfamily serine protease